MTEARPPRAEPPEKAGEGDFLRSVAEAVLQLLVEADVEGLVGAARHSARRSARPTGLPITHKRPLRWPHRA
jgi:hypothetical protein